MKSFYITILYIVLMSCNDDNKINSAETNTKEPSDNIITSNSELEEGTYEVGNLKKVNFGESIRVTGTIDVPPQNKSVISTFFSGYISKTPLLVGDKVTKGQLLVSLQNPDYVELQQNYLEIAEKIEYYRSEFERQKTLYSEDITSRKNFLKAQSTYKSNLALLKGLRKQLQMMGINPEHVEQGNITSHINIYAPINGFVTEVNVSNGAYVSPEDIILEIVDTEHIHLELLVFEKDVMQIKKGQKIEFKIPEASEELFTAEVHLVGTSIDNVTRRVKVHGHVDDEENQFMVGMYVDAQIYLSDNYNWGIPKTAILNDNNKTQVLVVQNSNDGQFFEKVTVQVGTENETNIELLDVEKIKDKPIVIYGADEILRKN